MSLLAAKIFGLTAVGLTAVAVGAHAADFTPFDGNSDSKPSGAPLTPAQLRHNKIQNEINRLMFSDSAFQTRLATCKVGGSNGVPANPETVKTIVAYVAGQNTGYYKNTIDIISNAPYNFNKVINGEAGSWTYSDDTNFSYPNLGLFSSTKVTYGLGRYNPPLWQSIIDTVKKNIVNVTKVVTAFATGGLSSAAMELADQLGVEIPENLEV